MEGTESRHNGVIDNGCAGKSQSDGERADARKKSGGGTVARSLSAEIFDWNFDVYKFATTTPQPLTTLTMHLLREEGLLEGWKLDAATVEAFLTQLEEQYNCNPYHNAAHAADVTQAVAVMIRMGAGQHLSQLEKFCLYIGAASHDIGHPGVNNNFLVATRHEAALLYNNTSVNENMHISRSLEVAAGTRVFENFAADEAAQIEGLLKGMLLFTDMSLHFSLMKKWEQQRMVQPDIWQWQDRMLLLQMILHVADLINPARDKDLAVNWCHLIMKESYQQGDLERELGLPLSALCDREVQDVPSGQLQFIRHVVKPTVMLCRPLFADFVDMAVSCLERTESYWQGAKEAEQAANDAKQLCAPAMAQAKGAAQPSASCS